MTDASRPPILTRTSTIVPVAVLLLILLGWGRIGALHAGPPMQGQRGDIRIEFARDGHRRTSVLLVPEGSPPAAGWPVVLLLHGAGGNGEQGLDSNGWRTVALRERFVVVAADGTPADENRRARFLGNMRTWNSGTGSGLSETGNSAVTRGIDDVGFLVALLDTVARRVRVDARRIFVAGHSNGAGMTYRLAAEHPERFAAVGTMAGHLFADAPRLLPSPVPLVQIVGDADPLVPMRGGPVRVGRSTVTLRPALESPARWAAMNGVRDTARIIRDDSVTVRSWGSVDGRRAVTSYVVKGHGHRWLWPGADRLPERVIGPTRAALNATETMWAFFAAHPRSAAVP